MTRYISTTETAKLIREALKVEFPGVKFSVTSKSYSGGSSIRVKWTDGPTTAQVKSVTDFYQGSTFDPMIDLKSSVYHTAESGETIHYGADHVFTDRALSAGYLRPFCEHVAKRYVFRSEWPGNSGDRVTPEYEVIEESSDHAWIKNLNTAYFSYSNFAEEVFKIAQKHQSFDAFMKHIQAEEQQRQEWAKEHEQEKKWDAALAEAAAANDPEPIPFDELDDEKGEQVVPSEDTLPDDKHDLRYYRLAKTWHDQPLISLPSAVIQTKYGDMTVEVTDGETITYRISTPFKINSVLYDLHGRAKFSPYKEDWHYQIGLRRVQDNGVPVRGNIYPTDKAYNEARAALAPLLETWLERNYELLPVAKRIAYANLIQRARYKLDDIVAEVNARRKWLDIIESEVRSSGHMAQKDHDSLTNIYGGYEWNFG